MIATIDRVFVLPTANYSSLNEVFLARLRQQIVHLAGTVTERRVVLDVSQVPAVGARLLGILAEARSILRQRNRQLAVRGANEHVQRVLDLAALRITRLV